MWVDLQIDVEFDTLVPDCPDFLHAFPAIVEKLLKYGDISSLPVVRQAVQAAASVDMGIATNYYCY